MDDSATLRAYQSKWLGFFEQKLYAPFEDGKPLLEKNKYCFLCHEEGEGEKTDGLPIIAKTNIPTRWLKRGEYDHRAHDKIKCETCHGVLNPPQPWGAKPGVENSEATSDVNLPARALCQTCHIDGTSQSAGTQCTLCHLYHDTTKDPMLRRAEADREIGRLDKLVPRMIPVGRAGTPEDIAATCAFLCSDAAGFITGQVVGVNGGMVL